MHSSSQMRVFRSCIAAAILGQSIFANALYLEASPNSYELTAKNTVNPTAIPAVEWRSTIRTKEANTWSSNTVVAAAPTRHSGKDSTPPDNRRKIIVSLSAMLALLSGLFYSRTSKR